MSTIYNAEKNIKAENSTLKKRGQITIPKRFRDALDLREDDQLEVTVEDGKIIMQPVITIAKDQKWFWSPEWQKAEREADDDISKDNVKTFNNPKDAIAYLRSEKE